jgi:hypothetical protein
MSRGVGAGSRHARRDRADRNVQGRAPFGGRVHRASGHRQPARRDLLPAAQGRPLVHITRATQELPREPLEIKPHPYGVELGILQKILQDTDARTVSSALQNEFSRVTPKVAEEIVERAHVSPRAKPHDLKPGEVERLTR